MFLQVFGVTSAGICEPEWRKIDLSILQEHTLTDEELEKSVLKEFGRCLEQIIESATSCLPQQIQAQQSAAAAGVASPTVPSTSTAH